MFPSRNCPKLNSRNAEANTLASLPFLKHTRRNERESKLHPQLGVFRIQKYKKRRALATAHWIIWRPLCLAERFRFQTREKHRSSTHTHQSGGEEFIWHHTWFTALKGPPRANEPAIPKSSPQTPVTWQPWRIIYTSSNTYKTVHQQPSCKLITH